MKLSNAAKHEPLSPNPTKQNKERTSPTQAATRERSTWREGAGIISADIMEKPSANPTQLVL